MQLRWSQIDPLMAQRVWESQCAAQQAAGVATVAPRRKLEPIWSVVSLVCAVLIVGLYVDLCFNLAGPAATFLLLLSPGFILAAMLAPNWLPEAMTRGPLQADALRRALGEIPASRAERLYGEMLLMLFDAPLDRRAGRDLLRQCNALIADDARLAAQAERLRAWRNEDPLAQVDRERRRLTLLLSAETDSVIRRSLEESLEMAAERRAHLEALPTLAGRLDAHRELICQTLLLAHAVLLRERAAPLALAAPDVAGLRESVRQIAHQTRAMEEAASDLPAVRP